MLPDQIRQKLQALVPAHCYLDSREDILGHAYDSQHVEAAPDAVLAPESTAQVAAIVRVCRAYGVPVTPRGAGSGTTGGAVPLAGGIVLSLHRMNRILHVDEDNFVAEVQPGVITGDLHKAVEARGLFYPPDPASLAFSTLGGNIAENAGGMRALKYGVTANYVMGLEVVLPTGEVITVGSPCVKDVVGYTMTPLFVGSEGTLGIVTRAWLRLLPLPVAQKTARLAFADMEDAGRAVAAVLRAGVIPTSLEFMDRLCIEAVESFLGLGLPAEAGGLLILEVDGDVDVLDRQMHKALQACASLQPLEVRMAENEAERQTLWKARRSMGPALLRMREIRYNEDIVVPRSRIAEMVRRTQHIAASHGLLIANFGHAGDGNIHVNVLCHRDEAEMARAHAAVEDVFRAAVELGGRITGEHGVGLSKKAFLGLNMDPPTQHFMRCLKDTLDPQGLFNPGKIFVDNGAKNKADTDPHPDQAETTAS